MAAWRNGRRAGLRNQYREVCEFDSHRSYMMILGIIGIVLGVLAIVLGIVAYTKSDDNDDDYPPSSGGGSAGISPATTPAVIATVVTII